MLIETHKIVSLLLDLQSLHRPVLRNLSSLLLLLFVKRVKDYFTNGTAERAHRSGAVQTLSKLNAMPTVFPHAEPKPPPKESEMRAEERRRQETFWTLTCHTLALCCCACRTDEAVSAL